MATNKQKINGYSIVDTLGEGNYTVIYQVKTDKKKPLVLKIAKKASPELNELISREFQILSQFQHPNIVPIHDYGVAEDGRGYFTMTYIDGVTIDQAFTGFGEEFITGVLQIINALGAFHSKGFVHGDLAPENILYIKDKNKVVLIDFAFAGMPTEDKRMVGTIGYIAPEIYKGMGVDQRSDLYSLGVILFEVLAGEPVRDPYVPIKGIPEEINNIIARCISKEPAIRPTMPELHDVCAKYLPSKKVEKLSYTVTLPQTGFVELPEIFEKVSSARGQTLIISGNQGMGKTRFLQEIQYRYLMRGHAVHLHSSREKYTFSEGLRHFIGLDDIKTTETDDKFQVFEEITQAVLKYTQDKHLVILVDDLHDLSEYERALFRYLGYGISDKPVLIIGASRPDEQVNQLGFETLALRPFTDEETAALVEKTFFALDELTTAKGKAGIASFPEWLYKQTGGNPLFITETLKTLYSEEVLIYRDNKWHVKINKLQTVTIPTTIEDFLNMRVKALTDDELNILQVLALADYPLEPIMIKTVFDKPIDLPVECLKSAGYISESVINNTRFLSLANQALHELIENTLAAKDKKSFGKKLIAAIEKTSLDGKDYLAILAELCDLTGELDKGYNYHQKAAKQAEVLYDYYIAIYHYKKTLQYEKSNKLKTYTNTLIELAHLNEMIGSNKQAIYYYEQALAENEKESIPKILTGLGLIHAAIGEHKQAIEILKKASSAITSKKTKEYLTTINRMAYSLICQGEFKDAEKYISESTTLSEELKDPEKIAESMYYQTVFEWFTGNYDKGIEIAQKLMRYTKAKKIAKTYAYTLNILSDLYGQKGDINNKIAFLDSAISRFSEIKMINPLVGALTNKASLYSLQGDYQSAINAYTRSLILAQQVNGKASQYIAIASLANMYSDLGRFEEALRYIKILNRIKPDYSYADYINAMILYKRGNFDNAGILLETSLKSQKYILYYIGLSLIHYAQGHHDQVNKYLKKALSNLKDINNMELYIKTEFYIKITQLYYEIMDYESSMKFATRLTDIAPSSSKDYTMGVAYVKLCQHKTNQSSSIDIEDECIHLKNIGCIYDYAFMRKLETKSFLDNNIAPNMLKIIAERLTEVHDIFSKLGAGLELQRVKQLEEQLYPIIIREYSKRAISTEYLDTFSRLAELVSTHLGDEDFLQDILDLLIQTTGAERGALFIKTLSDTMEFAAGRNMDKTTIDDAGQLSHTAIREMDRNNIIFTEDALADPEFNIKKSVMLHHIHSLLCIPLLVGNNVIGALYLDSRLGTGIFGPEDKGFLLAVARILASVIEKSFAFKTMTEENILLKSKMIQEIGSGYLVGKSRAMKQVYQLINNVAKSTSPVVLLGETGTGKGMLARLIHIRSERKQTRFLTINCGTIPETLLESELFGHKRGSFTGAVNDKKGLLEEGEGGTVFLDEITNTSLAFQAKLLEAIEEKIIRRLGETTTRQINVRFLFATNRNLEIEVEESRFRQDLFYRINVFNVEVPPLRERVNDITVLAKFFIDRYSKEINKKITGFAPDGLQKLKDYYWPGNVRELQNVIERAVVLTKSDLISVEDLGFEAAKGDSIIPLKEIKKEAVMEALTATGWNVKRAAELLQIGRKSIYRYMKKFNISRKAWGTP